MSDGPINGGFGVNTLYMCSECTTVRYGYVTDPCPACGEEGVHTLKINEVPEEDA